MWISKSLIAVILGGGAGTRFIRLQPTGVNLQCLLQENTGSWIFLFQTVSILTLTRMFVLTQYNSASLNKHIKNTYQFSAFSSGFVDIMAAEQTPDNPQWFQGTADAVRQSCAILENNEFDHVLILSGDQLYQMDFGNMFRTHEKNGADITIATIPVTEKEATEFGILKSDEEHKITSFIEKPGYDKLPDWLSDTGQTCKAWEEIILLQWVFIFLKEKYYLDLLQNHKDATDFGKEIIPHL